MTYTIGQMAKLLDVSPSTLRYYDKEGLLPLVKRSPSGIRLFEEKDFEWLYLIACLKKAGMSIGEIRQYIKLALEGDATIEARLTLFEHRKKLLEEQMAELCATMEVLDYKCWFYQTAKAHGSIASVQKMAIEELPERFQVLKRRMKKPSVRGGDNE